MTLNDPERQNRGFYGFFGTFGLQQVYIIHKEAPRYWHWWHGIIGNMFRLKRSYSTPVTVSTAGRNCYRLSRI